MKRIEYFEAWLGDKFVAWKRDDKTKITRKGNVVTIVAARDRTITVTVNLNLIPAYSFG